MGRQGINYKPAPAPVPAPKPISKQSMNNSLASQLKGAITHNNTTYVGYTVAQIQKMETEKLNKKFKNLKI